MSSGLLQFGPLAGCFFRKNRFFWIFVHVEIAKNKTGGVKSGSAQTPPPQIPAASAGFLHPPIETPGSIAGFAASARAWPDAALKPVTVIFSGIFICLGAVL